MIPSSIVCKKVQTLEVGFSVRTCYLAVNNMCVHGVDIPEYVINESSKCLFRVSETDEDGRKFADLRKSDDCCLRFVFYNLRNSVIRFDMIGFPEISFTL